MIVITDGGSTKCDWILLNDSGDVMLKTRTQGLNPAVLQQEELKARILVNPDLTPHFNTVTAVDFYGAGCGTATPVKNLKEVLTALFPKAAITVNEDMAAAVYAATTTPGIVCILGTGSNSCYFDGTKINMNVASLGYMVMDEASGNYFGKQLLRDYFYKKMPPALASAFEKQYDLDPDVIKTNLYKKPNPNTYLASFAEFIFSSEEMNAYFYNLIRVGMMKFIKYRILCFEEAREAPVHFIGSIAHFSEAIIRDCLTSYDLQLGTIVRRPIDGLIEYYRKHKLKKI